MNYMVIYFNGRGNREKLFATLVEAEKFREKQADSNAAIWQKVIKE